MPTKAKIWREPAHTPSQKFVGAAGPILIALAVLVFGGSIWWIVTTRPALTGNEVTAAVFAGAYLLGTGGIAVWTRNDPTERLFLNHPGLSMKVGMSMMAAGTVLLTLAIFGTKPETGLIPLLALTPLPLGSKPKDKRCLDPQMQRHARLIDTAFANRHAKFEVIEPGYSVRFSLAVLDSMPSGMKFLEAFAAWGAEEATEGDFVTVTLPEEWRSCEG